MPDEVESAPAPVIIASSPEETKSAVEVKAAPMVEVEPEQQEPEANGPLFLLGILIPILVLLMGNWLLSGGPYDFNRREEVLLQTTRTACFDFLQTRKYATVKRNWFPSFFSNPPLKTQWLTVLRYTSVHTGIRPSTELNVTSNR